jgi:hypothetical protein
MINVKQSKNNLGKIFSMVAVLAIGACFPVYGNEETDVPLCNNKVKNLIESTWEDGINQGMLDHLYRIQSYVKSQISQLLPTQQTNLKKLVETTFFEKVANSSQYNEFVSLFLEYLNNLFSLNVSTQKLRSPANRQLIYPDLSQQTCPTPNQSLNVSDPFMEKGVFTFITSPANQKEIKNYRSVKEKFYLNQEDKEDKFTYANLETPVLFIKAMNGKMYVAYDLPQSLSLIKLRLLRRYKITFLSSLEGKVVEFKPTAKMIDIGNKEQYPFAYLDL